jgi:hypothetical protein
MGVGKKTTKTERRQRRKEPVRKRKMPRMGQNENSPALPVLGTNKIRK